MRGLAVGEQSSLTNPLLQLFARSGGFLTDIYSGSYRIEDIRDPADAAVVKVATAPLTAADKVGTGRYALATGSTATWRLGTHRAVVSYVMASGGPTYTQVIEFEVLDATDWPVSASYVGYLSTRQAYQDGFATSSASRQTLHRHIAEMSRMVESWTKRWFEPRYLQLLVSGKESEILQVHSPIIAIEDVYAIWKTTTGTDTYKYEQYLYKVYNRHLDGGPEVDDRRNPHIELVNVTGTIVRVSGFAWPFGNQNIQVRGVFGYTDPDRDPNAGQVLLGSTPRDIARALGTLLSRRVADPTMSDPTVWSPGSIKSARTRYQSVTFGGTGGGSSGGGGASNANLSGDPLIDSILAKYCRPPAFGAV